MRRGAVYFILPKCRPMMSLRSRYLIITTRLNDTRLRFELYNHGTTRTYIRPVNTFKSSRPNIRLHDHFDVDSNSLYLGEDKIPNVFYFFFFPFYLAARSYRTTIYRTTNRSMLKGCGCFESHYTQYY